MIELLVVLALRVMIGVAGAEGTVLRPFIAVGFVVLMRVDMRGGGVAQGGQRCGESDDEEQRSEWSDGHRASSGNGGMVENKRACNVYGQRERITLSTSWQNGLQQAPHGALPVDVDWHSAAITADIIDYFPLRMTRWSREGNFHDCLALSFRRSFLHDVIGKRETYRRKRYTFQVEKDWKINRYTILYIYIYIHLVFFVLCILY